jgi:hypothetical protein
MNQDEAEIASAVGVAISNQNETIPAVARATGFTRRKLNRKIAGKSRKGFSIDDLHRICCYIGIRASEIIRSVGL